MFRMFAVLTMAIVGVVWAGDGLTVEAHLRNAEYHERYTQDLGKASAHYQAVLDNPKSMGEAKTKAKLGLAACAAKRGKSDDAMALTNDALKDNPGMLQGLLRTRFFDPKSYQPPVIPSARQQFMHKRLRETVIKRITFKDAKVSEVVNYLREQSRKLNPKNGGINFALHLQPHTKTDKGKAEPIEPTITMDFDEIPLGMAIRYICEQANLRYRVDDYYVSIFGPNLVDEDFEKAFLFVDTTILRKCQPSMEGDANSRVACLIEFLEGVGVRFPQHISGDRASYHFNPKLHQLQVWNTRSNVRMMRFIIRRLYLQAPQVKLSAKLWELDVDAITLDRVRTLDIPAFVAGLPTNRRNLVAELTSENQAGKSSTASEDGTGVLAGEAVYATHELTSECLVKPDNLTVDVALDWNYSAWEPDAAPKRGSNAVKGQLKWAGKIKKTVTFWDGETRVIKLAPARPKLNRGALCLVVQTTLVDPAGIPIREPAKPKGGWLNVNGTKGEDYLQ